MLIKGITKKQAKKERQEEERLKYLKRRNHQMYLKRKAERKKRNEIKGRDLLELLVWCTDSVPRGKCEIPSPNPLEQRPLKGLALLRYLRRHRYD